jgi:hypothetical protein
MCPLLLFVPVVDPSNPEDHMAQAAFRYVGLRWRRSLRGTSGFAKFDGDQPLVPLACASANLSRLKALI